MSTQIGTLIYIAPEMLSPGCDNYTKEIDVYSFGLLMNEILTGVPPYQGCSPNQIIRMKLNDEKPK